MHSFCCYSSIENADCQSIHAARKNYANNIKRTLDFYYYSQFYMATFQTATVQHMACMQDLMHVYLFGVSINKMLILQ